MELFKASRQWSERPADERLWNVSELLTVTSEYKEQARTQTVPYAKMVAVPEGDNVVIATKAEPLRLTHWAFGQLAGRAGAPASYLRELPAELAARNLNYGLEKRGAAGDDAVVMYHRNGGFLARSITSERYERIWNADVAARLVRLEQERGFRTPPAYAIGDDPRARIATEADCIPGASIVTPGMRISPAGVYCSDHDMFAFMVHPEISIRDGSEGGLRRGFFCWNSEVGAASIGITTFLFRVVCGNHIVWDASDVTTVRVRHVGDPMERFEAAYTATVERLLNSSASDEEGKIQRARNFRLGTTKDEVLDKLFGLRKLQVSKARLTEAIDNALQFDDENDPYSAYGVVNGLTRVSQSIPYADERNAIDTASRVVMELAD